VLPIISTARSADATAAAVSRQLALHIALAASQPGGLCDHLNQQMCTLCDQWQTARGANRSTGQQVRQDTQIH
jgi:hypothetical protein